MSDILLKNRYGVVETFTGVERVLLKKADGEFERYVPESKAKPPEIESEEQMDALLNSAGVGAVYRYVATTGKYINGALYQVDAVDTISFSISYGTTNTYTAEKGMTWEDFVISDYNDGRVYIYNSTLCYRSSASDAKDGTITVYLALDDGTRTGPKPTDLIIANAAYGAAFG